MTHEQRLEQTLHYVSKSKGRNFKLLNNPVMKQALLEDLIKLQDEQVRDPHSTYKLKKHQPDLHT